MYDFRKYLDSDETILYQGKAIPGKGGKNIGGILLILIFLLVMQIIMISSVVTATGDGAKGIGLSFIVIFLVTLFFEFLLIYSLINNLFLKKNAIKDNFYCLTNKRAFKYELAKNKLVFGYLVNYDDIKLCNVKDNYGDVYMGILLSSNNPNVTPQELKELMFNPNSENMPCITFESIENPNQVLELAISTRDKNKFIN